MAERLIGLSVGLALVAGLTVVTIAPPLSAQQRQAPTFQPDPSLNPEDQLAPSQMRQPMPAPVPAPSTGPAAASAPPASAAPPSGAVRAPKHAAVAAPPAPATKPHRGGPTQFVVACSGPFAKDSGMLALAMAYDSRNVTYTEVDVSGTKVGASILFAKDPKRRLEVWWSNPDRTGTYLILINGQSIWVGPGGLKLGLDLEQLQKLNHKPFKLKGYDKDGVAAVTDWDGGALATLTGGCKAGVNMHADRKAKADAVAALPADKDYTSDDAAMRATKPRVAEILIGY